MISVTPATAPKFKEEPSIIIASKSISPDSLKEAQIPASKIGFSSKLFTAISTASIAEPFSTSTFHPLFTAVSTPSILSFSRDFDIDHAPLWHIIAGFILTNLSFF